jgi:CRP-like cAMP-binding protein
MPNAQPSKNPISVDSRHTNPKFASAQDGGGNFVVADQGHQRNRLLAAFPSEVLALIEDDLRPAPFAQRSLIFEAGEPIEHVYFPQTGLISLVIVTKDGNTVETSVVGREGAVGLHRGSGQRRSFTRANVQVGGTFTVIRARQFEQIANDSLAVRDLIARYSEVLWTEAQQLAACNAVHDASARLCRWLLHVADRIGSDHLPLTQEFLAQMLGVRRTTVTLLAQAMQTKGLIKYSRGHIVLLDRPQLAACACECYHVVRHDHLPRTLGVTL